MDDKIVRKTQDTLGKIIKKPPLTEKLLKKPPFRFLHDIITSVIKNTGVMKGLYTENELNSDQIKDKESKMAFLQKAIDFVSLVIGKSLSVRPSKVVAGHEPEKTNEFLQEIATVCNKKIDNDDYVKRLLKGEKPGEGSKPPKGSSKREEKKDKESRDEKRRERDGSGKENRERRGSGSHDRRERERDDKKESRSKDRESGRDGGDRERSRDRRDRDKENREEKEERKKRHRDRDREKDKKEVKEEEAPGPGAPTEPPAARIPRPSSAKGSRRRHREDEDEQFRADNQKKEDEAVNGTVGEDDLPPQVMAARRMARPASARPAPPKVKQKQDAVAEPDIRVGSGKHVTNVIVDNANQSDDDDDDNFMVEDVALPPPEPEPVVQQQEIEDDGEHGGLVKKMLETKKELEGGSQTRKTEVEKPVVSDATRRKEREMVQKEIDKLRGSIQTLTRSANPLGKIMDYVQEDLDSMQKELEKWKKENKEHTLSLKQEQSVTEMSIEPLKGQLKDLDQAIADQLVLIAAVKSNIMRNDEKIGKMLGSVSKS